MNIDRLSPSSYKSWDGCQHAFFLEQRLKYRFPPGKAADIGTATHKVLELLALGKLNQQSDSPKSTIKSGKHEIPVDKIQDTDFLLEIAKESFKPGYFTVDDEQKIRKYIRTALDYNNGIYNPLNREIVMPEKRVQVKIDEPWGRIQENKQLVISGIIDLITKTGPDSYEIIDWKSGGLEDWNTGAKIDYEYLYNDIQLRFYHYVAYQMYGASNKYLLTIFFLKHNKPYNIAFGPEDLPHTMEKLKTRYLAIKQTQIPHRNQTYKCKRFCPFGKMTPHGTNLPTGIQTSSGGIAKKGEQMTICDSAYLNINLYGLDWVEQNMGKYSHENSSR